MAMTKTGKNFSPQSVREVWDKAPKIQGVDWDTFRFDACGAWIAWTDHGNRDAAMGWEIDHIFPQSKDGGDEIDNLQPLHVKNNIKKGDSTSWDASKDKADVPMPMFAVLLEASGKLGVYPIATRLRSVDEFQEYVESKWPAKTSDARGRQIASFAMARAEAAQGRVEATAYALRAAIDAGR